MAKRSVRSPRWRRLVVAGSLVLATGGAALVASPLAAAAGVSGINPVRVDLDGHPANSGFLVFVENDVSLHGTEAEGTMAMGGNLTVVSGYNVEAGAPPVYPTPTGPGDANPTYLSVGGGISWPAWNQSTVLQVHNSGFTKVTDTSTYTAYDTDQNNAASNYEIVPSGAAYGTTPRINGTTSTQTPQSIQTPLPASQLDIPAAFALYRQTATDLESCLGNVVLVNRDNSQPLPTPIPAGTPARLTLTPGVTNVLNISASDLAALSELTFTNRPSADTPLLVNVIGTTFSGAIPKTAGIGSAQAPYILWDFAQETTVHIAPTSWNGGDSLEGTIYAPNASVTFDMAYNIEGNVVAKGFDNGSPVASGTQASEIHDFPFATTLSCDEPDHTSSIHLVKKVDGGPATADEWALSASGPDGSYSANSPMTATGISPGDYTLTEDGPTDGYTAGRWTCTGGSVDGEVVTVGEGAHVTCTIVNTYSPVTPPPPTPPTDASLRLVKQVDNQKGGDLAAGDWTLTARHGTGTAVSGSGSAEAHDLPPGDYTLGESGPTDGYTPGRWSCDGGYLSGDVISLTAGDAVTCTIVNAYTSTAVPPPDDPDPEIGAEVHDESSLRLVKHVDNAGGGTATAAAWTLRAAGPATLSGRGDAEAVDIEPGSYTLSEAGGPGGYAAGTWSCTGAKVTGAVVAVTAGERVTCQITNTFQGAAATLPATGARLSTLVELAVLLLGSGLAVVVLAGRRRRSSGS